MVVNVRMCSCPVTSVILLTFLASVVHVYGWESMPSIVRDTMKERLKKSIWSVVILALLVDTCAPALLHRMKRQDLGNVVNNFLQADDQAQLEYVRHGLDLLQQGVDTSFGQLVEIDQAQDRVFVASVQVMHSHTYNSNI